MDLSEEKHHFELTQNIQLHKILASNGFCQVQFKKKQKKRQYWGWNKVRSYFFHNAKMDVDRISTTLHCIGATSWKWKRSALAGIDGFRSQLIHSSAPERYPIDIPYQGQYWAFRRKTPAGFPDRSFSPKLSPSTWAPHFYSSPRTRALGVADMFSWTFFPWFIKSFFCVCGVLVVSWSLFHLQFYCFELSTKP